MWSKELRIIKVCTETEDQVAFLHYNLADDKYRREIKKFKKLNYYHHLAKFHFQIHFQWAIFHLLDIINEIRIKKKRKLRKLKIQENRYCAKKGFLQLQKA